MTKKNRHLEKKVCMANFNSKKSLARRKQKSRKYLTSPDFILWMNKQYVDIQKFGAHSIVNESETVNIQFD